MLTKRTVRLNFKKLARVMHYERVYDIRNDYSRKIGRLDYNEKLILAPMVRVGVLPFRLLARDLGADIVYSEELIDKKLIKTKRVVNEKLGTIDYIDEKNGKPVYQTCPMDGPATVLQLGTANADLAVQAALHLYQDYDALDVNMGCPIHFSTSGGMGSALLKEPNKIRDILTSLVRSVPNKSITCKIRLLANMADTLDLVRMIEQTGVSAIAVHARYVSQRPRDPAHLDQLEQIVSAVSIPVIANGDAFEHADINKIRQLTKCSSIMIARGALWDPSIFSNHGMHLHTCAYHLIRYCRRYETHFLACKYILQKMFEHRESTSNHFKSLVQSKTYQDIEHLYPGPTIIE
jgi:tRNA-dihydrouridine synthase 2